MKTQLPLAGVIGNPIAHSKSPILHGHWLKKDQIPGFYVPLLVEEAKLERLLGVLPELGFRGVNVTIPHKEAVLKLAKTVSDAARSIGAANTLTFDDTGQIHADNTDWSGFLDNIKSNAPNWSAKDGPALVLGAGGAARAIVYALLHEGAKNILISNRTRARAEQLNSDFADKLTVVNWDDVSGEIPDLNLLVNTTSLGMTGQPPLTVDFKQITAGTLVTDIVYAPLETELLRQARLQGAQTVDGLGMLLHQAAPGFCKWFGVMPTVTDELRQAVLRG
jgi:shikimate dehydrogenase